MPTLDDLSSINAPKISPWNGIVVLETTHHFCTYLKSFVGVKYTNVWNSYEVRINLSVRSRLRFTFTPTAASLYVHIHSLTHMNLNIFLFSEYTHFWLDVIVAENIKRKCSTRAARKITHPRWEIHHRNGMDV